MTLGPKQNVPPPLSYEGYVKSLKVEKFDPTFSFWPEHLFSIYQALYMFSTPSQRDLLWILSILSWTQCNNTKNNMKYSGDAESCNRKDDLALKRKKFTFLSLLSRMNKVTAFLWLLEKEAILTWNNLRMRGWVGHDICILCKFHKESRNQMFLNCAYAAKLWSKCTSTFHIDIDIAVAVNIWARGGCKREKQSMGATLVVSIW